MASLERLLNEYEVAPKSEYTHTCLKNKKSYYIGGDQQDIFYELYKRAYGTNLSLTEKHRPQSPIIIDFDFRQETNERQYTTEHLIQI
jgi:hypothetical protein